MPFPRHAITALAAVLVSGCTTTAPTLKFPAENQPTGAIALADATESISGDVAESLGGEVTEPVGDHTAEPASTCTTWQDYRTGTPALPTMPAGFEQGCIFTLEGPISASRAIYILQNGIDLSDIAVLESVPSGSTPPQIQLQPQLSRTLVQSDAVLTYFPACSLIDTSRHRNCDNPPTYQAYLITHSGTVCFQSHCLRSSAISTRELLALWGNPPPEQALPDTVERSQYASVPLETVVATIEEPETAPFSETIFGSSVVAYSPWAIALRTYGRTTLGEGQAPTVITEVEGVEGPAVVVTNFGSLDDSIGGSRHLLDFEYLDGNKFGLTSVGFQQYCRRATPPQWTTALCP
ncbi:MAG: hypothetical protein AAF289_15250 [Cyanobacteria bacterium P01_A01_bin.135]